MRVAGGWFVDGGGFCELSERVASQQSSPLLSSLGYLGGASRVHLRVAGAATDTGGGLSKVLPPTPTPPPNKAIMITTNKKKKQNSK